MIVSAAKQKVQKILVKLVGGLAGLNPRQRATVRGLGLRKRGSESVLEATPAVMGMVRQVRFLVEVEEFTHE